MSNGLLGRFASLFGSDLSRWACEFTPGAVAVVQVAADRRQVVSTSSVGLPEGAIRPGLKDQNIVEATRVEDALERALREAGFRGSEIVVVIPDDAARISLLETESFPSSPAEQASFIRWKLKKSVQFDVAAARVACENLGENGVVDLLTVLSPESVMAEYEAVVEGLGLHPGVVSPSTTAALKLLDATSPVADTLFVKLGHTSVVTTILSDGKIRFYRKVSQPVTLEEAVHPTLMYYQDKLADREKHRSGIEEMTLCSESGMDDDMITSTAAKLGLRVRPLYSAGIDDIYKPALGALRP